jgi:Zn-dependent peptidase ImmA (M78 family)
MQATLQLSVDTLSWAAAANGFSLPDFAHSLYKTEQTASNIVQGQLTVEQLKKFSEKAKVPFGFLFLDKPPKDYKPDTTFVDFRTVSHQKPLSADFKNTLRDVEHKQTWYRNYLVSIDANRLAFVGKFSSNKQISNEVVAKDIRDTLNLGNLTAKNADEYLTALSEACEKAGILIFKNSIVINATRKPLNVQEFRGFVITDEYAPCVFINSADSKNANVFTLAHELAHIWLGESGVSDTSLDSGNHSEAKCNAIAALILVPTDSFLSLWNVTAGDARDKIKVLNTKFKVSELVIARTALTHQKISRDLYNQISEETEKAWKTYKEKIKQSDGGPSSKAMVRIRNSKTITNKVVELVKSNKMMPSEASILLNKSAAMIGSL